MNLISVILIAFVLCMPSSGEAIEVYLGGKHFNSFEDYEKIRHGLPAALPVKVEVETPMPQLPQEPALSAKEQALLDKVSYDAGVHHVIVDFGQSWQNPKPKFIVGTDELKYSIREAMQKNRDPALLISEPGKMRIMSYNFKKETVPDRKTQKMDKSSKNMDNKE